MWQTKLKLAPQTPPKGKRGGMKGKEGKGKNKTGPDDPKFASVFEVRVSSKKSASEARQEHSVQGSDPQILMASSAGLCPKP